MYSSHAYPNFEKLFVLHTDAPKDGLGAVLYHHQNDILCIVAYGSRTLTPAEKNYHLHSGKLEFLALKWAICDQFRDYLYYAPSFKVYTDNNPLTYVLSSAKLNATGLRWIGDLADFNFTIHYRPGKANIDADTLLRMVLDDIAYMELCTDCRVFCKASRGRNSELDLSSFRGPCYTWIRFVWCRKT